MEQGKESTSGRFSQNLNTSFPDSLSSVLQTILDNPAEITAEHRLAPAKLAVADYLFEQGLQFFIPVHKDSKIPAWTIRTSPISAETLHKLVFISEKKDARQQTLTRYLKYDLAIQTGTWHLPSHNPDQSLIIFDIDHWNQVDDNIKQILENNLTFTVRTRRGAHFYFWVPRFYRQSLKGLVGDWLGWGRFAVLTGHDRGVALARPIRQLEHDTAQTLYQYMKHNQPAPKPIERWKPSGLEYLERNFEAVEGERNYKINATLYRFRNESEERIRSLAIELADQCNPPYPHSEATSIAESILRHRHRFPVDKKPFEDGEIWVKSYAYQRMGSFLKTWTAPFTTANYEHHLEIRGCGRDKKNRIQRANRDIRELLDLGELRQVGWGESRGGRRPALFEPTRKWEDTPEILPIPMTNRNLRLSRMLALLPDEPQEVVRQTLANALGGVSTRTVTRYAKILAEYELLGTPMLERKIRKPQAVLDELGRKSFVFRPTVYNRTEAYHFWRVAERSPNPRVSNVREAIQGDPPSHNCLVRPIVRQSEKESHPKNETPTTTWADLPPPERFLCPICQQDTRQTGFCPTCNEKISLIREQRTSNAAYGLVAPTLDFCEFSQQFFYTEELPLRGVHPEVEPLHFSQKPPIQIYYCPNPECSKKIHTAFYLNYELPNQCSDCHTWVGGHWVRRPNQPESDLIGYPINRYNAEWKTLFSVMDAYWNKREAGKFVYLGQQFEALFTEEQLTAWREYRAELFELVETTCQTCGQNVSVSVKKGKNPPKIERCEACFEKTVNTATLPNYVELGLKQDKHYSLDYFEDLYEQLFGKLPKKQKDLGGLVKLYPPDWIELALYVTKRRGQKVNYPFPYTRGILENWQSQGHINRGDQREKARYHWEIFNPSMDEAASVLLLTNAYLAYENHIAPLNRSQAVLIQEAIQEAGEEKVILAISEAVRRGVRVWTYCEGVLERLQREMGQPLVTEGMSPFEQDLFQQLATISQKNQPEQFELIPVQMPTVQHHFAELEKSLEPILAEMEAIGFPYDKIGLHDLIQALTAQNSALEHDLRQLSPKRLNPNSSADLNRYLFEELGIGQQGLARQKKKGLISITLDVLTQLAQTHPQIQPLLDYRQNDTQLRILKSLLPHGKDGRFYPTYHSTITGRLTTREPNLQGLPADLRHILKPREGYVFISADYSQIELRVLAFLSGDKTLQTALASGADLHNLTAARLFETPPDEITPQQRNMAKTVNFGILYGMGNKRLAEELKIKPAKAKQLMEDYFRTYPQVEQYIYQIEDEAFRQGYVENPFGRQRVFIGVANLNNMKREARNFPIQSMAADLLKLAMLKTHEALKGLEARMVLQIHDEILMEAQTEIADQAQKILKNAMLEAAWEIGLQVQVNLKSDDRWGDLEG